MTDEELAHNFFSKEKTMKKITKFDPATCKLVAERIEKTLADLGVELGVAFRVRGGSFTDGNYHAKLEVAVQAADGSAITRESEEFKKYAHLYDLKAEDLGRTFDARGEKLTIVGLRARAQKYPILVRKTNGDVVCMRSTDVAEKLRKAAVSSPPSPTS